MKKTFLLLLGISLFISGISQSFDLTNLRVGGGFYYATEIKNIGLTLNGAYEITDEWEVAIAYTHIFEKDYMKWNILDFDAHYLFYEHNEKFNVYGLAGFSFTFWKVTIPETNIGGFIFPETTTTGSDVGFNLGAGANYKLSDNLNLAPEMRFTLMDGSYLRIGATLQYMF